MAINTYIANPVSQTITDGVTNKAPSENAVFDALAGKLNNTTDTFTGTLTLNGKLQQSYTDVTYNDIRPVINQEYFYANPSTAVLSLTDFHGIDLLYNTTGSNINNLTNIYAFESQINHTTDQNFGRAVSIFGLVDNEGSGTMDEANPLQIRVRNNSSGVISVAKGIRLMSTTNNGGGSISESYGIYIEESTAATTNYGIYSLTKSFFNRAEIGASAISSGTTESLRVHSSGLSRGITVVTNNAIGLHISGSSGGTSGITVSGNHIIGTDSATSVDGGAGIRGIGSGSGTQIGVIGQATNASASTNIGIQARASGATTNIAINVISGGINFSDLTNGCKIGMSTGQKIGFWNATPVVQQVLETGAGKTVDEVITFLQKIGLCKQS